MDPEKQMMELATAEGRNPDIAANPESVHPKSHDIPNVSEHDTEKGASPSIANNSLSDQESEGVPTSDDTNIVTWDGDDDPQNPLNWPLRVKWGSILVVSGITVSKLLV